MDIDICYIGYVPKKDEYKIDTANPLYLLVLRIDGFIEEKKGINLIVCFYHVSWPVW